MWFFIFFWWLYTMKILIKSAKIVNEGKIQEQDLYIKEGRIEEIAQNLTKEADKTIDASGLHLLPGMIDDQVHFREPGLMHKAEIKTESMAAVAGGITSFMEMPNTNPITDCEEELKKKLARASQKSLANYAFYLGGTNNNLEQIKSIDTKLACGLKVFMGSSTGNMLVDDPDVLAGIFKNSPLLIVTHCEDTPLILENEKKYRRQYGENFPMAMHAQIRSREACLKSSALAVELAQMYQSNLHVLHITTKEELALFQKKSLEEKKITAEVCVHHLSFSEKDYSQLGGKIKCNPSIKEESDRLALVDAVNQNLIDIIATDHAPHTLEEKLGGYFQVASGLPLVQQALLKLLEFYHEGTFSLERIVEKTSHNVAKRYQIKERGFIREGYLADLVLVDLKSNTKVTPESLYYKCGWSPFMGTNFHSQIKATFVNGHLMYKDGKIISERKGQALEFNRDL